MADKKPLPRLRQIEATEVDMRGRRMICLTDPLRIVESQVIISPAMMLAVMHFDGEHTALDAQETFMGKFGVLLPSEKIDQLADALDKALFLDNDAFHGFYDRLLESFAKAAVREEAHAGQSYEADPAALRAWIDGLFRDCPAQEPAGAGPARGLIVPHYDLRKAGPAFAGAYSAAKSLGRPDAAVVLGTGHFSMKGALFTCTAKDFRTPLGTVPALKEAVGNIADECGKDVFEEEILHAKEHSIEFQALFLQYTFPGVPFVPVLVSNFHQFIGSGREPSADPRVSGFAKALTAALSGMKVLFVASVDFAHVGARFGDPWAADEGRLGPVEAFDRKLLGCAESCDPAAFFREIDSNLDATRICGFPAIYTLLTLIPGAKGKRLSYEKVVDASGSAVTFASMIFV